VPTYRRIERGQTENPGLRYLVNAALALGVELDVILEDRWREWMVFDESRPGPPIRETFWRRPYEPGAEELDELLRAHPGEK
jgi:transcriptional regulator with XRE-family HTH domain